MNLLLNFALTRKPRCVAAMAQINGKSTFDEPINKQPVAAISNQFAPHV
jgi:hypothetical protein